MSISKSESVLLDSIKDLDQTYIDVRGDITTMRNKLDNLQQAWVGRGGTAFQGAITAWQTQANRVLQVMETFSEELGAVEQQYGATEDQVSEAFNKYAGGLGG
jgi:WXG100 family type VII secretion target